MSFIADMPEVGSKRKLQHMRLDKRMENSKRNCSSKELHVDQVAMYDKYSHKKFYAMVMNEAELTKEQRARLWHWRLGHPSHKIPK